jgi:hypothetical protein
MSFATLSTSMGDRFGGKFYFDRHVRGPLLIRFLAKYQVEVIALVTIVGTEVARPSDTN